MAKQPLEERKARAERKRAFNEAQPDVPPVMERGARRELEAKALDPTGIENKALDVSDLENKSKAELYEIAQERDIEGRSSMSKAELVEVLSG